MKWRRQLEQQQMDSVRRIIDPAYQGILAIQHLTKANPGPAAAISSLPVPTPQPPITAANAEVLAAQQQYGKKLLSQFTIGDTIHAGNTGGYYPGEAGSPGTPGVAPKTYRK
jgi:hypothetical protein